MSEADVAAIFGRPTNDLTGQPPLTRGWIVPKQGSLAKGIAPPVADARLLEYPGRRATVAVEFDASGRLVRYYPLIHEVSGLERVRLRLTWW
jgi:hypothetical protein